MELLVVTLAQVNMQREADALARMRVILDTVRNAPGLINARFYRSKEPGVSYCMLTTWESPEWWQQAQERYAPRTLLLTSPPGIFHTPPDQWLMHYLWGYSRPQTQPGIAAAYLALVRPEMGEQIQHEWLESLRQQATEPIFSFAMLARSVEEEPGTGSPPSTTLSTREHMLENPRQPIRPGTMFFNLLSWPGEKYREDFYANQGYQNIQGLLSRTGMLHTLMLDPV